MPGQPGEPIIRVRGLVNRFGAETVHDGLDLDVFRGEVLGVVGGSGSGKSVLLRTIIGLNRPVAGNVEVFGSNVLTMSDYDQREIEQHWGVLFQDGALFSSLTVAQNIEVPLKEYYDMPLRLMDEIAAFKVGIVGLPDGTGEKYPSHLSGGMRKRAGLARALALDPGNRLSRRAYRRARPDSGRRIRHPDPGFEEQPGPHRIHGHPRSRQFVRDLRSRRRAGRQEASHRDPGATAARRSSLDPLLLSRPPRASGSALRNRAFGKRRDAGRSPGLSGPRIGRK